MQREGRAFPPSCHRGYGPLRPQPAGVPAARRPAEAAHGHLRRDLDPDMEVDVEVSANANLAASAAGAESIPEQYLILVKCRDEKQQVELLERFGWEGPECKACWRRRRRGGLSIGSASRTMFSRADTG